MIAFENVSKSFWTGARRKIILDRASFRIEMGCSLGILAPNGAGKTTIINMMAGLEKPDEGTITRTARISFPLGFMGGVVPKHTGRENARYIARLYGLDPDYVESFVRWVCGIEEYFDMPVGVYSQGMRSRFSFGLMLALEFDIYLIDEGMPATTDVEFNRRAGGILRERLKNATVVVVSHQAKTIEKFCRQAAVLRNGQLYMFETLEEAKRLYDYDAQSSPVPNPRPEFPAAEPAAEAKPPAPVETLFDDEAEDGFGDQTFATAGNAAPAPAAPAPASPVTALTAPDEIDAIRREGLTGRQLRLARRVALKHGLPATSDFDAVRLLRRAGIDPFQRGGILELVHPDDEDDIEPGRALTTTADPAAGPQLPQTYRPVQVPSTETRAETSHVGEIQRMQADLVRRRRRKSALLSARLFFFVGVPTMLCAWYFYVVATPLFATRSEFVIQQSAAPSAQMGGLGSMFQGSPFATSQDSIAVQGYLQSREAMQRLDADHGFVAHFSDPAIDPIQRLDENASAEAAYKTYKRNVLISYDPTEGIIKMEVIAADAAKSAEFARALIGYAEGQVDQLTQRLRGDQMKGARESYEEAEANMLAAQRRVVELQEQYKVLSSEVEVQLITAQITQLESLLTQDKLSLDQMQSNANPNQSRMDPLIRRIAALEAEIATLRGKLTEDSDTGQSLAKVQGDLLVAQADVQTRQMLLAQSLSAMESARTEANRQVRYLSLSVSPVPPDEATYPRAFENTMVSLLVFAGIYLMLSMTTAILREQISG